MSGDPYDDGILGDRFEDEVTTSDLKSVKIVPDHVVEENGIFNPKYIIPIIGCGGCLIWVALMIAVLALGVYAIKWACFFFSYVWNMQL